VKIFYYFLKKNVYIYIKTLQLKSSTLTTKRSESVNEIF
jgi:hypothetical protein